MSTEAGILVIGIPFRSVAPRRKQAGRAVQEALWAVRAPGAPCKTPRPVGRWIEPIGRRWNPSPSSMGAQQMPGNNPPRFDAR